MELDAELGALNVPRVDEQLQPAIRRLYPAEDKKPYGKAFLCMN